MGGRLNEDVLGGQRATTIPHLRSVQMAAERGADGGASRCCLQIYCYRRSVYV